jgi:hypothetical protein
MIGALILSAVMATGVPQAQARTSLGIFQNWGAFRDASPRRCFAIARPVGPAAESQPFASIATWPGDGVRGQLHIRLSRTRNPRSRVMLSVGERRFELMAGERDAWAPDTRTDLAIVAAIRQGRSMSVETMGTNGGAFADTYALQGAATAIDAAALGCLRR